MDRAANTALMIVAAGVVAGGLYFFRGPLTQFALAMMLFLGVSGFTRWLRRRIKVPEPVALGLGLVLVVSLAGLAAVLTARNVLYMRARSGAYEARLDALIVEAYAALDMKGAPPTVAALLERFNVGALLRDAALGAQNLLGDAVFIAIYLVFIIAAASTFHAKIDAIFPDSDDRAHAHSVLDAIARSMETYLWVQTVISLIISVLTYLTFAAIGLDNPVFWAFVIFFLNYIPTVGSMLATLLPTVFAVVQFDSLAPVAMVAAGAGFWQFVIGNFVQPRMMSDSLNLSALVVLLSLAVWGLLWGIAGAFLSAPLTVMAMIVCAQFGASRWIAVLLSADGKPAQIVKNNQPMS
jgi:predicted PurR-regulated permease PerM